LKSQLIVLPTALLILPNICRLDKYINLSRIQLLLKLLKGEEKSHTNGQITPDEFNTSMTIVQCLEIPKHSRQRHRHLSQWMVPIDIFLKIDMPPESL
jgi:hypothetical protein